MQEGSLSFTAALALGAACPALVAHAALAYPGGRLRSAAERAAVAAGYLTCVGLAGVVPTLLLDPAAEGCGDCPRNLLLITRRRRAWPATSIASGCGLGLVWTLLAHPAGCRRAVGVVAQRAAPWPSVRLTAPVLVAAPASTSLCSWRRSSLHGARPRIPEQRRHSAAVCGSSRAVAL